MHKLGQIIQHLRTNREKAHIFHHIFVENRFADVAIYFGYIRVVSHMVCDLRLSGACALAFIDGNSVRNLDYANTHKISIFFTKELFFPQYQQ